MWTALHQWVTGTGTATERTVVVESDEHVQLGLQLAAPDGIVFAPRDDTLPADVVGYTGDLAKPGGSAMLENGQVLHVQDYRSLAFQPLAGPTAVRVTDDRDFEVFLDDADLARSHGVFLDQLIHPLVWLADHCALGSGQDCLAKSLGRVHIARSGEVRGGPGGAVLGTSGTDPDALATAARSDPVETCLSAIVDSGRVRKAVRKRPWLPRYLAALDAFRALRGRGRGARHVSGFGRRLVGDLPPVEPAKAPLVLWNDSETYVYQPSTGRCYEATVDEGKLAEVLAASASLDEAVSTASALLDHTPHTATEALLTVASRIADVA